MGVRATQLTVAHLLGLPLSHVRVLAPFVGGGFGMKAMVWPQRHAGRDGRAPRRPAGEG